MYIYDTVRSLLLRMRNISEKIIEKIKNTHCIFSNFSSENLAVYEIMWENVV